MYLSTIRLFCLALLCVTGCASAAPLFAPGRWDAGGLPFDFKYGGKDSSELLPGWKKSEQRESAPGGEIESKIFTDPATGLKVTAEVRKFTDYPAVEWVLKISNEGTADTPIIESIEPLFASAPVAASQRTVLRFARGSNAAQNDFEPQEEQLDRGRGVDLRGRSSNGELPFFDLQSGSEGVIGAIGWSGSWHANFALNREGTSVAMSAGMRQTHLLLHSGEEIRTPRILLMNWTGDQEAAHNLWRRLLLAYYTPQENGKPVIAPASALTWGNDTMAHKIAQARDWADHGISYDVYWMDAGWYGNERYQKDATVFTTPWFKSRGSWWPDKENYPQGLKPLADYLHSRGMKYLVWFEPEEADPGSTLLTEHPGWFLRRSDGGGLLNLGNPEARKGITDIISDFIGKSGIDWFRTDYNLDPAGLWRDPPDRVGMTEIKYVEGLYAFWDDLRAAHPGLKIDNCSGGGRRIDIETMSRSVALWRSDYMCDHDDPMGAQLQIEGLAPWVPLSAGCCDGNTVYALRSAYSPGLNIDEGCLLRIPHDDKWLKAGLEEFHRARPYFYGDYYSLLPYTTSAGSWSAIQFDRPDLRSGVAIYLRRPESRYTSMEAALKKIDPNASYIVEARNGLGAATPKKMRGAELANLAITIPSEPGSLVLFYERQ